MKNIHEDLMNILREEYKGLGYIPSHASDALRSDRDEDRFREYRLETGITKAEMNSAVAELLGELALESAVVADS